MVQAYQAMQPLASQDVVRGQFRGYHDEEGVAADSTVETYVAVRLGVNTPRWEGVPFYIRTGKCLAVTANEVLVELKPPPWRSSPGRAPGRSNVVRFGLGPDLSIAMSANVRKPESGWELEEVEMVASREFAGDDEVEAYHSLLASAMRGNMLPFTRADGVEAQWRVVEPCARQYRPAVCVRARHLGSEGSRSTRCRPRRLGRPQGEVTESGDRPAPRAGGPTRRRGFST